MVKMKKSKKILIIIILILVIVEGGLILKGTLFNGKDKKDNNTNNVNEPPKKELKIINLESNTRPIAVMINNHSDARKNHAGLQDAYIIYEIIVEGGLTRYLALFKDQNTERIGSVRSSRHYFLDYAMENDAIYVHWGWSPQAQEDIKTLKINNINGLTYEGKYFFRDKSLNVALEHTGFTTMEMIKDAITNLKYRNTTEQSPLLHYTTDEVELNKKEGAVVANNVSIKYSNSITSSYEYDEVNKVYNRFVNGKVHKDAVTGNQYTFKNIIAYAVKNDKISNDNKGRQDLQNIGSGEGVYITNGYSIPIKWSKASRSAKTKYTYMDGTEIDVSDGNTFIQIYPTSGSITIE